MTTFFTSQVAVSEGAKRALGWVAQTIVMRGLRKLDDRMLSDLGLDWDDINTLRSGTKAIPESQTKGTVPWHI